MEGPKSGEVVTYLYESYKIQVATESNTQKTLEVPDHLTPEDGCCIIAELCSLFR
jgi:hypothetical protein